MGDAAHSYLALTRDIGDGGASTLAFRRGLM